MSSDVLFFAEQRDASLRRVALESATAARQLADELGGRSRALVIGNGVASLAPTLAAHGADEVYLIESAEGASPGRRTAAEALAALVRELSPRALIVPSSAAGKDIGPRVAAMLGLGFASDCVSVTAAGGVVRVVKPVYSGKLRATYAFEGSSTAVVGIRPNVFTPKENARPAAAKPFAFTPSAKSATEKVVGTKAADGGKVDLGEARIIVSGGRGMRGPENFPIVQALADALGGAMGASRAAVDAGWIDHSHQVGQTGRTVSPDLYVACGISGAIQHLAGMSSSRVIVAINKDPEAPIFKIADYGIVGDLFEVVPILTEKARAMRGD